MERVTGIEPVSSAWKANIINHYTIPASGQNSAVSTKPRMKKQPGNAPVIPAMVGVPRFELGISCSQSRRLKPAGPHPVNLNMLWWQYLSVPRVRIGLTTQGFSVLCSTTELPRL